jgi:hypothetical protein
MYSDATWSGTQYLDEAIDVVTDGIGYISQMLPKERGLHLGQSILQLRSMLKDISQNDLLLSDSNWREEYENVSLAIDGHIAYNAYNQKAAYRVSWQEASAIIFTYINSNRVHEVFNQDPELSYEDKTISVGIDFVSVVVGDILN